MFGNQKLAITLFSISLTLGTSQSLAYEPSEPTIGGNQITSSTSTAKGATTTTAAKAQAASTPVATPKPAATYTPSESLSGGSSNKSDSSSSNNNSSTSSGVTFYVGGGLSVSANGVSFTNTAGDKVVSTVNNNKVTTVVTAPNGKVISTTVSGGSSTSGSGSTSGSYSVGGGVFINPNGGVSYTNAKGEKVEATVKNGKTTTVVTASNGKVISTTISGGSSNPSPAINKQEDARLKATGGQGSFAAIVAGQQKPLTPVKELSESDKEKLYAKMAGRTPNISSVQKDKQVYAAVMNHLFPDGISTFSSHWIVGPAERLMASQGASQEALDYGRAIDSLGLHTDVSLAKASTVVVGAGLPPRIQLAANNTLLMSGADLQAFKVLDPELFGMDFWSKDKSLENLDAVGANFRSNPSQGLSFGKALGGLIALPFVDYGEGEEGNFYRIAGTMVHELNHAFIEMAPKLIEAQKIVYGKNSRQSQESAKLLDAIHTNSASELFLGGVVTFTDSTGKVTSVEVDTRNTYEDDPDEVLSFMAAGQVDKFGGLLFDNDPYLTEEQSSAVAQAYYDSPVVEEYFETFNSFADSLPQKEIDKLMGDPAVQNKLNSGKLGN